MKRSLKSGLYLVTESNVFTFNNRYYKQIKGAPMGWSISGLFAEFKLRRQENNILKNIKPAPSKWIRYIDDVFAVWDHGLPALKFFFKKINKVESNIQFTRKLENNNTLQFLDILLIKKGNKIFKNVYRKKVKLDHIILNDAIAQCHKIIYLQRI